MLAAVGCSTSAPSRGTTSSLAATAPGRPVALAAPGAHGPWIVPAAWDGPHARVAQAARGGLLRPVSGRSGKIETFQLRVDPRVSLRRDLLAAPGGAPLTMRELVDACNAFRSAWNDALALEQERAAARTAAARRRP